MYQACFSIKDFNQWFFKSKKSLFIQKEFDYFGNPAVNNVGKLSMYLKCKHKVLTYIRILILFRCKIKSSRNSLFRFNLNLIQFKNVFDHQPSRPRLGSCSRRRTRGRLWSRQDTPRMRLFRFHLVQQWRICKYDYLVKIKITTVYVILSYKCPALILQKAKLDPLLT